MRALYVKGSVVIKVTVMIISCIFLFACQSTKVDSQIDNHKIKSAINEVELTMEDVCKVAKCRVNKHIQFRTDNGNIDQVLPLYWPAAYKDKISILPGDKLFVEAEVVNGQLGNFKSVNEIINPEKTIQFSFTQMDSSLGMMLSVKNPFPTSIKYHLNMIDFGGNSHKTSSCPVNANLSVFESWPHVIPELTLTDMHFLKETDVSSCVY